MARFTLLTGASGLVGSYLMRDLLRQQCDLAVIVRPRGRRRAAARVESILQAFESQSGCRLRRPVCLQGDVNLCHLGLSPASRRWIARNCDRIIHNAASVKFRQSNRSCDPWKTNVAGTQRVLNLCRRVGISDFHYVSTAYVCGTRTGVIREDDFHHPEQFRNDYEHSKYLAEQLVRNDDFLDEPTIYRPVAIAGDSETGYTNSYHGVYVYLRLLNSLFKRSVPAADGRLSVPLRIALDGNERRNLVPINWVSQLISFLSCTTSARGATYHLAPRERITARSLLDAVYAYYGAVGLQFCGPNWEYGADIATWEATFLTHSQLYKPYELSDPEFDTSNVQKRAGHLPCPVIDEAVVHKYLQYCERNLWGRRPAAAGGGRAAA